MKLLLLTHGNLQQNAWTNDIWPLPVDMQLTDNCHLETSYKLEAELEIIYLKKGWKNFSMSYDINQSFHQNLCPLQTQKFKMKKIYQANQSLCISDI